MKDVAHIGHAESLLDRKVVWLYLFSGLAALIYEVCLVKSFSYILGGSSQSLSTVLAAFMGGLALGSLIGGRLADRVVRPLRVFGLLEGLVGVYGLLLPLFVRLLHANFAGIAEALFPAGVLEEGTPLTVLRVILCVALTIIPVTLMGATFPLVSRASVKFRKLGGRDLGALYAANTLGAVAGVILCTYALIYLFGISSTIRLAALVNFGIFGTAWILSRGPVPGPAPEVSGSESGSEKLGQGSRRVRAVVMTGALFSGFISFLYEVGWNQALQRIVGSSIYSLGIILATVLLGMALGSWILSRWFERDPQPLRRLAPLQLALGLSIAVSFPFWDRLPWVFSALGRLHPGFVLYQAAVFMVCAAALLLPCVLMGIQFPLLLHANLDEIKRLGSRVGSLTFLNTAGAIFGSLVTGFVLISWIGSERTIALGVALNAFMCLVFLWGLHAGAWTKKLAATGAVAVLAAGWILFTPKWDPVLLNSGSHVYLTRGFSYDRLLYEKEDMTGGTTSVIEKNGVRTMLSNGKFQGDDGEEIFDNRLFARAPMMVNPSAKRVLVIGLGPGIAAATFLKYPVDRLEVAEFSPRVVEAARDFFSRVSGEVFIDPRAEIIEQDGRLILELAEEPYDVISIQVSSVWIAGAANIYSRDFYRLCRERLSPGGVMQQWIQFHHLSVPDMVRIMQSMRSEFSYVSLWMGKHQGVLVASNSPQVFNLDELEKTTELLKKSGGLEGLAMSDMRALLGTLVLDPESMDRLIKSLAADMDVDPARLVSSDDRPVLEYTTPMSNLDYYSFFRNKALLDYFKIKGLPKVSGITSTSERHLLLALMSLQSEQYGLAFYEAGVCLEMSSSQTDSLQCRAMVRIARERLEERPQ